MAVTVSIRNTDADNPINITSIRYYDTDDNLVAGYAEGAILLNPWATESIVIEHTNKSGGVGANFIVDWEADGSVSEPVIETVMVSTSGTQGLGLAGQGQVISQTS